MRRFLKSERGSVVVLVAAGMVMLMGFAAFAIDIGMMTIEKSRLQNAVDAAALAGAQELPDDTSNADSTARDYVNEKNAYGGEIDSIVFSQDDRKITIEASKEIPFIFAKVLGISEGNVQVKASAIKGTASGMSGLRPFGIFEDKIDLDEPGIVLKVGSHGNESGNFGIVGLANVAGGGTTGGNIYEDNIATGCGETYSIGDKINTETGNKVGPTEDGLERISIDKGVEILYSEGKEYEYPNRLFIVPVIESIDPIHGTTEVEIIGFAAIFVESFTYEESLDKLLKFLSEAQLVQLAYNLGIDISGAQNDNDRIEIIIENGEDEEIREEFELLFPSLIPDEDEISGNGNLVIKGHFLEMLEGYEPDTSGTSYGIEAVKLVE